MRRKTNTKAKTPPARKPKSKARVGGPRRKLGAAEPIAVGRSRSQSVQARVGAQPGRPAPIRTRAAAAGQHVAKMARPVGAHFEVYALAGDADVTTIDIYDVIGEWGVNARTFREALNNVRTGTIQLRINSPGGSVFDAVAMYNDLVAHPARVEVQITGLAASAASLLAMAGDTIEIADNAFFMIHNTWTVVAGDRREMASAARTLERFDASFAKTYARRTGIEVDELHEMMDAETWLDAGDAVDLGFADSTVDAVEDVKGKYDLSAYVNAPSALMGSGNTAPQPSSEDTPVEAPAPDLSSIEAALARLMTTMKGSTNAQQNAGTHSASSVAA